MVTDVDVGTGLVDYARAIKSDSPNVLRMNCSSSGGSNAFTADSAKIGRFQTLCRVRIFLESIAAIVTLADVPGGTRASNKDFFNVCTAQILLTMFFVRTRFWETERSSLYNRGQKQLQASSRLS